MPEQTNISDQPSAPADSAHEPSRQEVPAAPPGRQEKYVVVRYGRMGQTGLASHELDSPPIAGTMLVVRTERGTELGQVLINVTPPPCPLGISMEGLENYLRACGQDYPFIRGGRALRRATPQDINDQQHLNGSAREELTFCREQIAQLELKMKLVSVEHLLGGERIVFYFTAEQRVDFRELVRRLAGRYHTRIEMRQVGARDEARLVADLERCGRRCCCQEYLKFLKPVSMKMAKMQKATLDPTKISGRCGRLMCCLRYEDQTYEQLQANLPRKNTWVRTGGGVVGRVLDVQILTQLVRLVLPDLSQAVVPNEEIVERGVAPPPMPPPGSRVQEQEPRHPRPEPRPLRDTVLTTAATEEEPPESPQDREPEGLPEEAEPLPAQVEQAPEAETPETEGPRPAQPVRRGGLPPQAGRGQQQQQRSGQRRRRNRRRRKNRHGESLSVPPTVNRQRPPGQPPRGQSDRPPRRPDDIPPQSSQG